MDTNKIRGLDAALYQTGMDWPTVAKEYRFLYAKFTEGRTLIDPLVSQHAMGAFKAGLKVGGYHYFHPSRDPVTQADNFLRVCKGLSQYLTLPLAVDVETDDAIIGSDRLVKKPGVAPDVLRGNLEIFRQRVEEATKRNLILYTYPAFAEAQKLRLTKFIGRDLWIAHYTVRAKPWVPQGWSDYRIWQYSGSGKILGSKTTIDLNLFNGDLEGWAKSYGL